MAFKLIRVKKFIESAYIKGGTEHAYLVYRILTGADVKESWRVVKPWIKEWEGKVNGK